jgi:flavin-binding protein dodecin
MQCTTNVFHALEFEGASTQSWELAVLAALDSATSTMHDLGADGGQVPGTYRVRLQLLCEGAMETSCVLNGI